MCLGSKLEEFQKLCSGILPFIAYKVINRNLKSRYKDHTWLPNKGYSASRPSCHPLSRKTYKISRSFHAYRTLNLAKAHAGQISDLVIIRIVINPCDVTGANEYEVSASSVRWNGDYYCDKTKRWKKFRIQW